MDRPGRRLAILLVTQFSPPANFSASRRVAGLTKYLARLGHRVTVLTSMASGSGAVPGAARVVRTRDLIASGLNWRRSRFESLSTAGDGGYEDTPSAIARWVVPDLSMVGWLPFALPRALGLAREQPFDCVITTSPPESAHFVGLALRQRAIPWIADLRDGWRFETTHPDWPLLVQHRLDDALEALIAHNADLLVAVSEPITDDLRERLDANAVTLTNGYDPEERGLDGGEAVSLTPDRHSLVHTGRMGFAARSPRPLLEAIEELRLRRPDLVRRLEVVFAGPLSREERALLEARSADGVVSAVGTLERPDTIRLQRAADSLLLLTGRGRRSEATAKLYEYLAAGRPILVLGEQTAAAETVRSVGAGIVTSASNPAEIADALERLLVEPIERPDPRLVERFSYEALAARLAGQVERLATT